MEELREQLQQQFDKMCATGKLFRSSVTGQQVWDKYLQGFTDVEDPVFRDPESSSHNCNNCKNFVRRYGNIVALDKDLNIMTIFDVEAGEEYTETIKGLSELLKTSSIVNVFFETFTELNSLPYESCSKSMAKFKLGTEKNHKQYNALEAEKYGIVKEGEIRTFHHLVLTLPAQYVDQTGSSIEAIMAEYRSDKEVFKRAMDEIPSDTLELVIDLINQGSLLNGDSHVRKVEGILELKKEYNDINADKKDNWAWVKSSKFGLAKFRNELIGVLCTELAEGKEINEACKSWNKRVDPANYMKAVAPITETQKKNAQQFVEDNGYAASFDRRLATLDDIKVTEIKHINNETKATKAVSMFDNVKPIKSQHKRNEFDKVEEVSIEKFMSDILPGCSAVELYLENRLENNLVTMTTTKDLECKNPFKWNNPYSWTYKGNLAGKSELTQMVEARGGNIEGVFRFSHSWNELERNESLMDLHVFMPGCELPKSSPLGGGPSVVGRRVGWNQRTDVQSGGRQDVDNIHEAKQGEIPVENITFPTVDRMPEGVYTCMIHNYNFRKTGGKGRAEVAIGNDVYQYIYPATKMGEFVTIAEVTLKGGMFTIEHKLPVASETTKEMYSLESNNFHKVNLMCLSPNYWDGNEAGNKHYLFMLDGCKIDGPIRSFHNENLNTELLEHRKVLDILGAFNMVSEPADKQLSGIGFNATVKDEVILKLSGNFKRVIKVKF